MHRAKAAATRSPLWRRRTTVMRSIAFFNSGSPVQFQKKFTEFFKIPR
jgi:hypothetical protein